MNHKHLAANIRKWFEYYYQLKQVPGDKEAALADLSYIGINIARPEVNWISMYQWLEEQGEPDKDFFLFWQGNFAHTYFRDNQVALMFKLRWI